MTAQSVQIGWSDGDELTAVADFVSDVIHRDPRYISHGEIQTGLSPDGATWATNLHALMREDFADLGPERRIAVARDAGGELAGAAVVLTVNDDRAHYVVIEDIAVAAESRSHGVGRALVAFIETTARAEGAAWAFLESGLENAHAHDFFERQSYRPLSKVFGKRL
ncbi:MAG TPA: GNAT family N-acetyltransferase [Brevundimonas sp.]